MTGTSFRRLLFASLAICVATSPWWGATAKEPVSKGDTGREVDLFAAMEKGDLQVTYTPRNSREGRVVIKNTTDQPLTVKLPDAFAGSPVLAQQRAGRNTNTTGRGQTTGGGFGGGGFGGGGFGGGGQFSIPAEKVVTVKATTVCLEHGLKEPASTMPYEIKPISSFSDKPEVAALCNMVGTGAISQSSGQAAAWYLASDMSWDELAAKRAEHLDGSTDPYFNPDELQQAMSVVKKVQDETAKDRPEKNSKKPVKQFESRPTEPRPESTLSSDAQPQ